MDRATAASYEDLRQQHEALRDELAMYRRWAYGPRREQIVEADGQQRLFEMASVESPVNEPQEQPDGPSRRRRRRSRNPGRCSRAAWEDAMFRATAFAFVSLAALLTPAAAWATSHPEATVVPNSTIGLGFGQLSPAPQTLQITLHAPQGSMFYGLMVNDSLGLTAWSDSGGASTRTLTAHCAQEDNMGCIEIDGMLMGPAGMQNFWVRVSNVLWPCESCPQQPGCGLAGAHPPSTYCSFSEEGSVSVAPGSQTVVTIRIHHGLPGTLELQGEAPPDLEILNLDETPFSSVVISGSGMSHYDLLLRAGEQFSGEPELRCVFTQNPADRDSQDLVFVRAAVEQIQVTMEPDPVRVGYRIRDNGRLATLTPIPLVTATVTPPEAAQKVTFRVVGVPRVTAPGVERPGGGRVRSKVLVTQNAGETPPDQPDGDTTIQAVVNLGLPDEEVAAEVQVIVIVPTSLEPPDPLPDPKPDPYTVAMGPLEGPNTTTGFVKNMLGHSRSKPAFPKVRANWRVRTTVFGHNLTITVLDQFGIPLDELYKGESVFESFDGADAENPEWFNINQVLSAHGTYQDPVGMYNWPEWPDDPVKIKKDSPLALAWMNPPPMAQFPIGEHVQRIRVRVAGHELTPVPAIINRHVISSRSSSGEPQVEIRWPPRGNN